jgi:hypothetical protein
MPSASSAAPIFFSAASPASGFFVKLMFHVSRSATDVRPIVIKIRIKPYPWRNRYGR